MGKILERPGLKDLRIINRQRLGNTPMSFRWGQLIFLTPLICRRHKAAEPPLTPKLGEGEL